MITIIHGEDIISAQKYKSDLIVKNIEKEVIELINPAESEVLQAIESKSLFGEDKIVMIFKILKLENIAKALSRSEINVYLFFEKNLTPKQLSTVPKAQVILFKPKAVIFDFLDSIKPNNTKNILTAFFKLTDESELIFYMLIRQFRNLILVKEGSWTKEISPWQKSKLSSQAQYYSLQKLLEIYKYLEKIDFENKTGQSPLELSKSLELFLLKI